MIWCSMLTKGPVSHTFPFSLFFPPTDEHNDVQKKTFTKWINARFSKVTKTFQNLLMIQMLHSDWWSLVGSTVNFPHEMWSNKKYIDTRILLLFSSKIGWSGNSGKNSSGCKWLFIFTWQSLDIKPVVCSCCLSESWVHLGNEYIIGKILCSLN